MIIIRRRNPLCNMSDQSSIPWVSLVTCLPLLPSELENIMRELRELELMIFGAIGTGPHIGRVGSNPQG